MELKNTMMIAKHAAAEFFKVQGRKNNDHYNKDMSILMSENLSLKKRIQVEEIKTFKLIEMVKYQEEVNTDLKSCMFECFNQAYTIFNDKNKHHETVQHLLKSHKYAKDYMEVEKIAENPFTLYGSYLDMLRKPVTEGTTIDQDIYIEENDKLKAEIEAMRDERDASL